MRGSIGPRVDFPRRFHLRRRETTGRVARLASDGLRIEMTLRRIFDHSVFHAIQPVASLQHGFVDELIFLGRNLAFRSLMDGLRHPDRLGRAAYPVCAWRTGDDAIEIVRVHLRFLQPLLAAGRAAAPIGMRLRFSVEGLHNRFRLHRHLVLRAISEIDQLLGMSERKAGAAAFMAGIGRGDGVACFHRRRHRRDNRLSPTSRRCRLLRSFRSSWRWASILRS